MSIGGSRGTGNSNTGLVHRVLCPFTPQLSLVQYSLTDPEGWHNELASVHRICE